jgi:hypothetical protein
MYIDIAFTSYNEISDHFEITSFRGVTNIIKGSTELREQPSNPAPIDNSINHLKTAPAVSETAPADTGTAPSTMRTVTAVPGITPPLPATRTTAGSRFSSPKYKVYIYIFRDS